VIRKVLVQTVAGRITCRLRQELWLRQLPDRGLIINEAQIRKRHLDDQLNQAACPNLVANAVVVWNTIYMWEVIERLRREG
jgi:Tn3 transposase DDE domain